MNIDFMTIFNYIFLGIFIYLGFEHTIIFSYICLSLALFLGFLNCLYLISSAFNNIHISIFLFSPL